MIVDPSSLIFVAVIGIWAAFLLGHWVRRRDQLATARSIDRFSDAMRVLERRAPAPTVGSHSGRAHVIAAKPLPTPRASASVRHAATGAVPARAAARGRTVRPSANAAAGVPAPLPAPVETTAARAAALASRLVKAGRAAAQRLHASSDTPVTRPVAVSSAAAHRRGRVLAGLVAATALGWVFAGATPLPWLVPAFVTCLLAAFAVGLRRALVRERTSARRAARAASGLPRQSGAAAIGGPATESRDVRLARRAAVRAEVPAAGAVRVTAADAPVDETEPELIDLTAAAADDAAADVHAAAPTGRSFPSAPDGPGWQPVPVPPPTYTLKPKAPAAPWPAPADAPVTVPEPPVIDLDEIIERRIASGA